MEDVKDCPFCAQQPGDCYKGSDNHWHLVCANCGARCYAKRSKEEAIALWNDRSVGERS